MKNVGQVRNILINYLIILPKMFFLDPIRFSLTRFTK
jgi:hypothetical protein